MRVVPRSGAFGAVAAGIFLSGALVWPQPSSAGQWRVTPSIGVTESFTDNSTLARETEDRNSDLITLIEPGVLVRGSGGRINLNFDYSLQSKHYLRDTKSDSLRNRLLGAGDVELVDRVLFLQGQASISRQVVDGRQPSSNSLAGEDINSATVRTFNLTPIFRHHFGTWVDTESSATISRTDTSEQNVEDTTLVSERVRAASGRRFTILQWALEANNSKSTTDNNQPPEKRRNIDGTLTYVYSSRLSFLGGLGWEDVRSSGLDKQPKGLTWQVGFNSRPGPVTAFGMTVGDRNDELTFNATGSHQFSPQTSVNASYTETIQTTEQQLSQNLSFVIPDPITGVLIDSRTNQPFVPGDPTFGLDNGAFRQHRLSVGFNTTRRRTNLGANVFYEEREFEVQKRNETAYGIGLNVGHRHTPRLGSAFNLNYRHLDPDQQPNRVENEGGFGTTLSYQVSQSVAASMAYNFTIRRIRNSPDDIHENSVSLVLRKTF